jgi:hypothetical protein
MMQKRELIWATLSSFCCRRQFRFVETSAKQTETASSTLKSGTRLPEAERVSSPGEDPARSAGARGCPRSEMPRIDFVVEPVRPPGCQGWWCDLKRKLTLNYLCAVARIFIPIWAPTTVRRTRNRG